MKKFSLFLIFTVLSCALLWSGEIDDLKRGDQAFLKGRYAEALIHYQRAEKENPQSRTAWFSLGVTYTRLGRYPQAEQAFLRTLSIDPNFAPACNNLGWVYLVEGKIDLAVQYLSQALTLQPDYPLASNNLGIAYLKNRNPWLASQVFMSLQDNDPANPVYLNNLGLSCFMLGDYRSAEGWLTSGIASPAPHAENYLNLALLYTRVFKPGEAQKILRLGLQKFPRDRSLQGFQAQFDYNSGATSKAYREWAKILNTDANNPWALSGLAGFYLRKGDCASALPYLAGLAAVDKNNYRIREVLGWAYYYTGNKPKAQKQWQMVNRDYPASPLSNYGLGILKLSRGDAKGAFLNFFQALEVYPSWVDARFQLARCYAKIGNKIGARAEWEKIREINAEYAQELQKKPEVKSWFK